ncbi:RNA polymerase sigma-70 factor [Sphingobacterium tabacisoli]|uniref:RNA polymerase sigma-70 factor n=1 Tax=Sphingobacterium tabacisoli TaxID=2044855 RepID=A0ABW5L5R1_9SPHI|nr:RNA polymerase sigma-70 factor [Sphingobacterium tabacisoli]
MKIKLNDLTDSDLYIYFKEGDEQAFEVVFKRYFKRLRAFALTILKDEYIAEELAIDVMLRLWNKKSDLSFDSSLQPFLFKCVKNAVLDHLKKKKMVMTSIDELDETLDTSYLSADSQLLAKELEEKYKIILAELPEQRRLIFHMSRIENMSNQEIADRLDISLQTVKNQISTSLKHFRKHFDDKDVSIFLCIIGLLFHR